MSEAEAIIRGVTARGVCCAVCAPGVVSADRGVGPAVAAPLGVVTCAARASHANQCTQIWTSSAASALCTGSQLRLSNAAVSMVSLHLAWLLLTLNAITAGDD